VITLTIKDDINELKESINRTYKILKNDVDNTNSSLKELNKSVNETNIKTSKIEQHLNDMNGKLLIYDDTMRNKCPERFSRISRKLWMMLGGLIVISAVIIPLAAAVIQTLL